MLYVGIDLHKKSILICVVSSSKAPIAKKSQTLDAHVPTK
jgi:hypothetical protein